MARAEFTITFPERKPGEPGCTEQQRQYIDHLLTEINADDLRGPALDAPGKWQASSLIERLKEVQAGRLGDRIEVERNKASIPPAAGAPRAVGPLASLAYFLAALIVVAFVVAFIK